VSGRRCGGIGSLGRATVSERARNEAVPERSKVRKTRSQMKERAEKIMNLKVTREPEN